MIRRSLILLSAALLLAAPVGAEPSVADLAGVYDGHQMEIGAELQLGPDGRFQYYLSYGALDEMATGTWGIAENGIVLTSDPVKAPAFVPVDSKTGEGSTFDLKLDVPDGIPMQFFSAAVLYSDGTGSGGDFDDSGLHLKLKHGLTVSAVALQFQIYDMSSGRIDVPPRTGSMHFRFEPNDLGSVAFDHQLLLRNGDAFTLSRHDRTLSFTKAPPPPEPLDQVAGTWEFTREDCETDSQFEPRTDLAGATFVLAPDHSYRLAEFGKETSGTFTAAATDEGYVLVDLLDAKQNFLLNGDQLESWSDDPVPTQCTQIFERKE